MSAALLLEQLINGLTLGGIYALVALGYTLVYGVLRMINFAHSELFMGGAVAGWAVLTVFPIHGAWAVVFTFVAAMVVVGGFAVFLDRVAYAPLRRAPRLMPLISAIGASLVLQNAVFLWRDNQLPFPAPVSVRTHALGPVTVTDLQIFIIATSVGLMALLTLFIQKTRMGKALRAVAQDASTAELMGIPVNRLIALTFFIGGALGAAAGVLNGLYYGSVKYNMGFVPGVKAFTAAVLGGIGNVPGAMLGGFVLGLVEALGVAFLPEPAWKDVVAFGLLIVVLVVRPSGLLGEHVSEKV